MRSGVPDDDAAMLMSKQCLAMVVCTPHKWKDWRIERFPCPEQRRVQSSAITSNQTISEQRLLQNCTITSHQTISEQRLVQSDAITSVNNFRLGWLN